SPVGNSEICMQSARGPAPFSCRMRAKLVADPQASQMFLKLLTRQRLVKSVNSHSWQRCHITKLRISVLNVVRGLGRAIPCSIAAQQRHKIIRKRVGAVSDNARTPYEMNRLVAEPKNVSRPKVTQTHEEKRELTPKLVTWWSRGWNRYS